MTEGLGIACDRKKTESTSGRRREIRTKKTRSKKKRGRFGTGWEGDGRPKYDFRDFLLAGDRISKAAAEPRGTGPSRSESVQGKGRGYGTWETWDRGRGTSISSPYGTHQAHSRGDRGTCEETKRQSGAWTPYPTVQSGIPSNTEPATRVPGLNQDKTMSGQIHYNVDVWVLSQEG